MSSSQDFINIRVAPPIIPVLVSGGQMRTNETYACLIKRHANGNRSLNQKLSIMFFSIRRPRSKKEQCKFIYLCVIVYCILTFASWHYNLTTVQHDTFIFFLLRHWVSYPLEKGIILWKMYPCNNVLFLIFL